MKNPLLLTVQLDGEELTAHLRARASGIYAVEWWRRGEHFFRSTKETLIPKARVAAGLLIKHCAREQLRAGEPVLLDAAVARYLKWRWPDKADHRQVTHCDHRTRLNVFQKFAGAALDLGALNLEESTLLIQRYLDHRRIEDKIGAQTIDNDRRTLSTFWAWLWTERLIVFALNPAAKKMLKTPRIKRTKKPLVARAVVDRLLELAKPTDAYVSIILMLGAGYRAIGTTRVTWADVDLSARTILANEKDRERRLPLSKWLVDELSAIKEARQPKPGDRLVPYEREWIGRIVKTIRDAPGADGKPILPSHVRLERLRPTFMARCYAELIPEHLTAKIAGNSPATIHKYYVDLQTMSATAEADRLDWKPTTAKTTSAKNKKRA